MTVTATPSPTPGGAGEPPASKPSEEMEISPKLASYFAAMAKINASDLHIKTNSPVNFRVKSVLRSAKEAPLSHKEIDGMIVSLLTTEQNTYFHKYGQVDLAYEIPGGDRFRINVFRQRGEPSMAVRRVTRDIPSFKDLHLPHGIEKITQEQTGLILLSGPTGSGKSTTIASMLDHINANRRCHIVTIEDPIEYLYEDKKALISQREIGIDVQDFAQALRALLREDPDIILIGELRDYETFEAAMQAAETGHLVLGTIHASTAPQTIQRILELFPSSARPLIMQGLAYNLRAIVCQKLLPSVKEGLDRVPAVEILRMNPTVRQLLESGRDNELADVIGSNEDEGMQTFSQSLYELIENDMIDPKVAYAVAPNPEELKMRMKGIKQSQAGLVSRE